MGFLPLCPMATIIRLNINRVGDLQCTDGLSTRYVVDRDCIEVNLQKDTVLTLGESGILRVLKEADVTETYVQWLNNYDVVKFTEQRFSMHDLGTVQAFVREKFVSNNDYLFGIFWDKCHIGNIKLGPINWHHLTADVSYFLGSKDHWGKGIATLAVGSVVVFADSVLRLKKLNAGYYSLNVGSARVLEKCGFKHQGTKISNIVFEGRRIDNIEVGLELKGI